MRRLPTGGRIDRSQPLSVKFDGKSLPAFQGDTLGSALLAGDLKLVGRSFKYHRPRGVYSAGVEEPGAMVHLRESSRHEPNVRATVTEAYDGLVATSQNAWPSLKYDIGAANNWISPFLSAGFYYKTFVGPFKHSTRFWMMCEAFIRKAAGMGRGSHLEDPDHYDKRHATCDVLVIGGGVAGLSAALAAGRAGVRVMLVEQDTELGGAILSDPVDGESNAWLAILEAELRAMDNVHILLRTTAFGAYDGDTYGLVERIGDQTVEPLPHQVRQRFWQVHAKRSVLASGAIERPMVFGGNDKPGVMLAGAARTYLNRYAILVGRKVVVATNNDSAYATAADLARAGAVVMVADLRYEVASEVTQCAQNAGVKLAFGHAVLAATGYGRVTAAHVVPVDLKGCAIGTATRVQADVIATSAGWSPSVHLWSQVYGKPVFDADATGFVPAVKEAHNMQGAGLVMAAQSLQEVIGQGFQQGAKSASACRTNGALADLSTKPDAFNTGPFWQNKMSPVWAIFDHQGKTQGKAFIDFQHDVKISDVDQAHLEGYVSVEHLKRYTTLGMATDQGKLSNINALSRMAELRGTEIPKVGTTTFRPPFTPITIGSLVGHERARHFRPVRLSSIHHWHVENGAMMTEAGAWMRPWFYPQNREGLTEAYIREAAHVRQHVGMVDVSTLGKIAVQGPDAAEFLNRIYVNGWKTLAVGRLRYGVMLREDGVVLDDGATARLGENDYFMTTTTANAARVLAFAELLLQTTWKDLKVHVTTVTDQWAAMAIAGPKSRDLLEQVTGAVLSRDELPNNHFTQAMVGETQVRIHRMSYSGELAYEVYVPAGFGRQVWEVLQDAGQVFNIRPYGTEAMSTLRIEKGHVAGPELEGRTTLKDLGLEGFASSKKPFVGSVLRKRPVLEDPARPTLVGLEVDGQLGAKSGSLLFPATGETKGHGDGWISSTSYSPALEKHIALGLLKNGKGRQGETVRVVSFVDQQVLSARVVSPHFFDPQGERQNG
ncbi:MAG: sarcosine oxidase subunit alpha family protein [Rhizobiaceae bacterium]